MRPAMPSALICLPEIGVQETKQTKSTPRPAFVPRLAAANSSAEIPPAFTVNRHVPFSRSTSGTAMASLPFFDDSTKELANGTCTPRSIGSGEATVRAQSHAITVRLFPA